jgi:hypothetical protein
MRLAEPRPSRLGLFSLSGDLGWYDFDGSNLDGGGRRGDQGPVSLEEGAITRPGTLGGLAVRL